MMRASSGDRVAAQPVRIAAPSGRSWCAPTHARTSARLGWLEDLRAELRVAADHRELLVGQPPGLVQDAVGHADLADVVQQPGQPHAARSRCSESPSSRAIISA